MTTMTASAPRPLALAGRLVGMIWSPRATLTSVASHPSWIGMLAVTAVVPALAGALFLGTEVGRRALVTRQVQSVEAFGMQVTDDQYASFERFAGFSSAFQLVTVPIWSAVLTLAIATLLFGVGYALWGARATFRQTYAVVVHAGVVFIVQSLFVTPLNYVRAELGNPATLAAFAPMLDADTFAVRFLSVIDVFIVWWLVLLAIGTSVTTGRATGPIAGGLLATYAMVASVVALVLGRLGA